MNRLREHLISLESVRSVVPNLLKSSRDKVNKAFSSMTVTEADYILKTDNTEKDLIELLISKMEIENILGLKFILGVKKIHFFLFFFLTNLNTELNFLFSNPFDI